MGDLRKLKKKFAKCKKVCKEAAHFGLAPKRVCLVQCMRSKKRKFTVADAAK